MVQTALLASSMNTGLAPFLMHLATQPGFGSFLLWAAPHLESLTQPFTLTVLAPAAKAVRLLKAKMAARCVFKLFIGIEPPKCGAEKSAARYLYPFRRALASPIKH